MTENKNTLTTDEKKNNSIGLALSGGGFRAAAFHLGVMDYLQRVDKLENLKLLSTVSGGTFSGVKYLLSKIENQTYEEFFLSYKDFLQNTNLIEKGLSKLNKRNTKAPSGKFNISISIAQVYADTFLKKEWNICIKQVDNNEVKNNYINNFEKYLLENNYKNELLIFIKNNEYSVSGIDNKDKFKTITITNPPDKIKYLLGEKILKKNFFQEINEYSWESECKKLVKDNSGLDVYRFDAKEWIIEYNYVYSSKKKKEYIEKFKSINKIDKDKKLLIISFKQDYTYTTIWSFSFFDQQKKYKEISFPTSLSNKMPEIEEIITWALPLLEREENEPYYFGDILNAKIDLPQVVFNAIEFNQGLAFRFEGNKSGTIGNENFKISDKAVEKIRMADIVTASSCFPSAFEPLSFPKDFVWQDETIPKEFESIEKDGGIDLMDGGVYDNQGIHGLLLTPERDLKHLNMFIISDADPKLGCDLRIEHASDEDDKKKKINKFKEEFKDKKSVCAVLAIAVKTKDPKKWNISGFNDKQKFQKEEIGMEDDLSKNKELNKKLNEELNKENVDNDEVVKLATDLLGSTALMPQLYKPPRCLEGSWFMSTNLKKIFFLSYVIIFVQVCLLIYISIPYDMIYSIRDESIDSVKSFFEMGVKESWSKIKKDVDTFICNIDVKLFFKKADIGDLFFYPVFFAESIFLILLLYFGRKKIDTLIGKAPLLQDQTGGYVKKIPIRDLIEMGMIRFVSLHALASSIFMKRIRALSYVQIRGGEDSKNQHAPVNGVIEEVYGSKRIINQINDLQNNKTPNIKTTRALQQHIYTAINTQTTLWFDPTDLEKITSVIITGQATMCYNLKKYLSKKYNGEPDKLGDEEDRKLWKKLSEDWDRFNAAPEFLSNDNRNEKHNQDDPVIGSE